MKTKLWFLQLTIVIATTFAVFALSEQGSGVITNFQVREVVYPGLTGVANFFSDLKFRIRGATGPKNGKIVIVNIDDASIRAFGRWPWHRDVMAELLDKTFLAGAQVVGLDMVFSEPDVRVSDQMYAQLEKHKLGYLKSQVETDPLLAQVISKYADRLVLGWAPQGSCQPHFSTSDQCPLIDHSDEITYPDQFEKFAVSEQIPKELAVTRTPLVSSYDLLDNIEIFNAVAKHSGFFQAFPDRDGVIRRAPLVQVVQGKIFPSLSLEMLRLIKAAEIKIELGSDGRIDSLYLKNSEQKIATTKVGFIEFNSRGPGYSFPYVSALDVLAIGENVEGEQLISSRKAAEKLKGAYVLVGVSALGAADLRAFTFDKIVPGVEGHATILDNLLSDDYIRRNSNWLTYLLVFGGGLLFCFALRKLESVQGLLVLIGLLSAAALIDFQFFFLRNLDFNLGFFYLEISIIFLITSMAKYILEEKDRKFIKNAFSRYVSPALVNSIIAEPGKLVLGGEKKNLTILFSDIRGFTTFSESVDAQALSLFLNDYLGKMTGIIFEKKGTLDKYIGDAVMAFWGAPLSLTSPASLACAAAIEMAKLVQRDHDKFLQTYGIELKLGIGVNTGPVNVGNMGSAENFSYTVIGDHVNIASRVESLTKHYGVSILTTRYTIDAILAEGELLPTYRTVDFVKVKGKTQVIEIVQLFDVEPSRESLDLFKAGHQAYLDRKWTDAVLLFTQSNGLIEKTNGRADIPSQLYIQRCQALIQNPPSSAWAGVWEMQEK